MKMKKTNLLIFSGVLLWSDLSNPYNWFLIFIVGGLGILGAYDDYKKIKLDHPKGVMPELMTTSPYVLSFLQFLDVSY